MFIFIWIMFLSKWRSQIVRVSYIWQNITNRDSMTSKNHSDTTSLGKKKPIKAHNGSGYEEIRAVKETML